MVSPASEEVGSIGRVFHSQDGPFVQIPLHRIFLLEIYQRTARHRIFVLHAGAALHPCSGPNGRADLDGLTQEAARMGHPVT